MEWWFFTAFSPSSDLGLALSYHPAHSGVSAMLYEHAATGAARVHSKFYREFDHSAVGTANASQTFGSDGTTFVSVRNESTYVVGGAIPDANLSWTLTYHQAVDAAREHVDVLGALALDWVSYMPSATLSGSVTFRGRTYSFADGVGYHDHNSGKWIGGGGRMGAADAGGNAPVATAPHGLPAFDYKWGSIYGGASGIGGVYGAYLGPGPLSKLSIDYIFVRAHGQRVKFGTLCGHHVSMQPLAFVSHPGGHREATAVRLTAESREWRLEWEHRVLSSAVNGGGTGLGLVVYEQLSTHNLTLIKKGGGGGGGGGEDGGASTFAELRGAPGFTEWSNPS